MKIIPINEVRSISKKTPINEIIEWFNEEILKEAKKFKNHVDINIGFDIDFIKDECPRVDRHDLSGKEAYDILPDLYKDAIKFFREEKYTFKYKYRDWYVNEPYSERWEKDYILTISW